MKQNPAWVNESNHMEYLQRLAETVLAQLQFKIYDRDLLEKYEDLFATELFGVNEVRDAYQKLIEEDNAEAVRYRELIRLCGDTEVGRRLLDVCLTALLYPQLLEFWKEYGNGLTLDAVAQLCEQAP